MALLIQHTALTDVSYQLERLTKMQRVNAVASCISAFATIGIASELGRANSTLDSMNKNLKRISQSVDNLVGEVRGGFGAMANQLYQQNEKLNDIAEILARPYEGQIRELRIEAARTMDFGMVAMGEDQAESFADAMRLYKLIIENPIGMQDAQAWHDIGWIEWKINDDTEAALYAFRRARRLTANSRNDPHLSAARHIAYLLHLKGEHREAQTIVEEISDSRLALLPHLLLDRASYQAAQGDTKAAFRSVCFATAEQPALLPFALADEGLIEFRGMESQIEANAEYCKTQWQIIHTSMMSLVEPLLFYSGVVLGTVIEAPSESALNPGKYSSPFPLITMYAPKGSETYLYMNPSSNGWYLKLNPEFNVGQVDFAVTMQELRQAVAALEPSQGGYRGVESLLDFYGASRAKKAGIQYPHHRGGMRDAKYVIQSTEATIKELLKELFEIHFGESVGQDYYNQWLEFETRLRFETRLHTSLGSSDEAHPIKLFRNFLSLSS